MAVKWSKGEMKYGREIGYASITGKYIWQVCELCGKERWVVLRKGKPESDKCFKCAHQNHHKSNWRGGKTKHPAGYIRIRLQLGDFFFPMADKAHYVQEHRLVMAKHLNRCLLPWEVVHHRGTKYIIGSKEDKGDNRLENLELITDKRFHMVDMRVKSLIHDLQGRVALLEAELELLRIQLSRVEVLQ